MAALAARFGVSAQDAAASWAELFFQATVLQGGVPLLD